MLKLRIFVLFESMPFSSVFKKRKEDTQPSLFAAAEPVESAVTHAGPAEKRLSNLALAQTKT